MRIRRRKLVSFLHWLVVGIVLATTQTGCSPAQRVVPAARDAVLQRLVDAWREANLVPGVIAALRYADGSNVFVTSGIRDLETGAVLTAEERFDIASITKMFTAAAIMMLSEEGRLSLEDPVNRFFAFPSGEKITIRHLLNHRSGLAELRDSPEYFSRFGSNLGEEWTAEALVQLAARQPLNFSPGDRFQYSDTNYILLAAIIEKVSGDTFAAYLREHIFTPLALENTFFSGLEERPGEFTSGYLPCTDKQFAPAILTLYGDTIACQEGLLDLKKLPGYQNVTFSMGASGIVSNAADLLEWGRALFHGEVARQEALAAMQAADPAFGSYGLGLREFSTQQGTAIGHTGGALGAESLLWYLPHHDLTLVILSNRGQTGTITLLAGQLVSAALGVPVDAGSLNGGNASKEDAIRDLRDPDPNTRIQASMVLGRMGSDAQDAGDALVELLKNDPDARVREAAALAVGLIGPEESVAGVLQQAAQEDADAQVRRAAALALETLKK